MTDYRIVFNVQTARYRIERRRLWGWTFVMTDDGRLADERLQGQFADTIAGFLDLVEASTHYPCIKRAWVEFLGEHPDPAIDRVDT